MGAAPGAVQAMPGALGDGLGNGAAGTVEGAAAGFARTLAELRESLQNPGKAPSAGADGATAGSAAARWAGGKAAQPNPPAADDAASGGVTASAIDPPFPVLPANPQAVAAHPVAGGLPEHAAPDDPLPANGQLPTTGKPLPSQTGTGLPATGNPLPPAPAVADDAVPAGPANAQATPLSLDAVDGKSWLATLRTAAAIGPAVGDDPAARPAEQPASAAERRSEPAIPAASRGAATDAAQSLAAALAARAGARGESAVPSTGGDAQADTQGDTGNGRTSPALPTPNALRMISTGEGGPLMPRDTGPVILGEDGKAAANWSEQRLLARHLVQTATDAVAGGQSSRSATDVMFDALSALKSQGVVDGQAAAVALRVDRRAAEDPLRRSAGAPAQADGIDRIAGAGTDGRDGSTAMPVLTARPVMAPVPARDLSALAERIELMLHRNGGSARLNLSLGDLGDVSVNVRMESRHAHIQFLVHDPAMREALDAQLPRLRLLLEESGLQLGDVSTGMPGERQQDGGERQRPAGPWTTALAGRGSADPVDPLAHAGAARRGAAGERILDAFA